MRADASIDTEFSGSTGVMGTVRKRTLTVANIGDSRVILGRRDPADGRLKGVEVSEGAMGCLHGFVSAEMAVHHIVQVSSDHKPDREDEQKRILARGGRVFAVEYEDGVDGPPRVWLGHMDIPGACVCCSWFLLPYKWLHWY